MSTGKFCCFCYLLVLPVAAVPSFDINLDADPHHRWDHVVEFYKEEIKGLTPVALSVIQQYNATIQQGFVANSGLDEETTAEVRGIVSAYKRIAGITVTFEEMAMAQLMYELATESHCSGFLMALPNGTVVHGRNLDNAMPFVMADGTPKDLPDVTFNVVFWRDGKPLMTAVSFPGNIGIHTGMRFGGWSIEQNTRSGSVWSENFAAAKKGGRAMPLVIRKALQTIPEYENAVQYLWDANFMAPMYLVVAGSEPYEGVVMAIDRGGLHKATTPAMKKLGSKPGIWHLYQANDDMDGEPNDSRRPVAAAMTANWHQEDAATDDVGLFMHTPPLLNPLTTFTWIAVPATNFYETLLPGEGPTSSESMHKFFGNSTFQLDRIMHMYPGLDTAPALLQYSVEAAHARHARFLSECAFPRCGWHLPLTKPFSNEDHMAAV